MKSKVKIDRILYPKNITKTTAGDFAIFTVRILDHIDGETPLVHPTYHTVTLKGIVPAIEKGMEFVANYNEPDTTNFGTSYKLEILTKEINKFDIKEVKEYLKFLCGETITDELMKLDNPLGMIESRNDEELLKVKGLGKKKLEQLYNNASNSLDFSVAYANLIPLGLTQNMITNICRALGSPQTAIELCKTNPYALVRKVKGISFIKADEIARKCGLDMNSTERLECAIYHILYEHGSNGRTYITAPQLMNELGSLNLIDWSKVNQAIMHMYETHQIVLINNGTEISLRYYFDLERDIAKELDRIMKAESKVVIPDGWEDTIRLIEEGQGWKHTDEQWLGIHKVLYNNVVLITGYGGTGKSTVTNAMTTILDEYHISQTCLSAKASQRLQEVTGRPASTIHRLLNLKPIEDDSKSVKIAELITDIVIIDEFSMVNGTLFLKLLKSVKNGTKLVLLGDTGQLQAIGDCSVMADMLDSGMIPMVNLTQIHRQAQKSAITTDSIAVRHQKKIYENSFRGHVTKGELQDLELFIDDNKENLMSITVRKFKEEIEKFKNILEVQIICPTKLRGSVSVEKINIVIQSIYNPKIGNSYTTLDGVSLYKGDKVINLKNNYNAKTPEGEKVGIFNGNIGVVKEVTQHSLVVEFQDVTIEFKGKERNTLNLAYAISVHSSQGSQWLSTMMCLDLASYTLCTVEMLYTGMSRASKHCSLIAEHKAITTCLRNVEQKTKQTYLKNFLLNL